MDTLIGRMKSVSLNVCPVGSLKKTVGYAVRKSLELTDDGQERYPDR